MAIADVKIRGAAYYLFDTNNNKTAIIPLLAGELLGICYDFVILRKGTLYYTYNEIGHQEGTVPVMVGDFRNAAGSSFNLVKKRTGVQV